MGSEISAKIIRRASSCQLGRSDAKKCQKSVWLWDLWSTQGTDGRKKTSVSFPKCLQDVSKWPMDRNKKVKEEGSKGRKKGRTAAIRIPAWSPTAVLADRYLA